MSDPNLWTGMYREWDRETRARYPIEPKPEWLWREEWDRMIWGTRDAMKAAMQAAVRRKEAMNDRDTP
jgi:hypothetical protein